MIGNCDALVTQSSSVVVVGLVLGEKVYSDYDINLLCKLAPIQNEGTSALNIAEQCHHVMDTPIQQNASASRTFSESVTWKSRIFEPLLLAPASAWSQSAAT